MQFNGIWSSSTRCEIAAAMIALLAPCPIHVGSDSSSMVKKASKLKAKAAEAIAGLRDEVTHRPNRDLDPDMLEEAANRCPEKRHWLRQKDGDLWKQMWAMLIHRNPDSAHFTWVRSCHYPAGGRRSDH